MRLGAAAGSCLLGVKAPFVWPDGGAASRGGGHAILVVRHDWSGHGSMICLSQAPHASTRPQPAGAKNTTMRAVDQGRAWTVAYADVQVVEREVREFVADEKRELSVTLAKINARESYGEGYNGDRMCRAVLFRISQNLAPGDGWGLSVSRFEMKPYSSLSATRESGAREVLCRTALCKALHAYVNL